MKVEKLRHFDEKKYREMQRTAVCVECMLYSVYDPGRDVFYHRHDLLAKTILLRMGKLRNATIECLDVL